MRLSALFHRQGHWGSERSRHSIKVIRSGSGWARRDPRPVFPSKPRWFITILFGPAEPPVAGSSPRCTHTAKSKGRGHPVDSTTPIQANAAFPASSWRCWKLFTDLFSSSPPLTPSSQKSVGSEIENHLLSPIPSPKRQFDFQWGCAVDVFARTRKVCLPAPSTVGDPRKRRNGIQA